MFSVLSVVKNLCLYLFSHFRNFAISHFRLDSLRVTSSTLFYFFYSVFSVLSVVKNLCFYLFSHFRNFSLSHFRLDSRQVTSHTLVCFYFLCALCLPRRSISKTGALCGEKSLSLSFLAFSQFLTFTLSSSRLTLNDCICQ